MKVNDVVFQNFKGIRRFGVVRQVEIHDDGWTYAGVKWIDDQLYERSMDRLSKLRGGNHVREIYRKDEVSVLDAAKEVMTLNKCMWWAEHEGNKS